MMRVLPLSGLLVSLVCAMEVCAAEDATSVWEMEVRPLPVYQRDEELFGKVSPPSLAGLVLYPEMLSGVKGFTVRGPGGELLGWRLEERDGDLLAAPGRGFEGFKGGDTEALLLMPVRDLLKITASDSVCRNTGMVLEAARDRPVVRRWFGLGKELPRDVRFGADLLREFLENEEAFQVSFSLSLWITDPLPERPDRFMLQADAWVYVPREGVYRLAVDGDDACMFRMETGTGSVAAFKSRKGMFHGRAAHKSRPVRLKPGLYQATTLLLEDTGAQGVVPFWQPPWCRDNIPLEDYYLLSHVPVEILSYKPLYEAAPHYCVGALRLAAFRDRRSSTPVAVYDLTVIPDMQPEHALYHLGEPLHGTITPDGYVEVRDLRAAEPVCARLLPSPQEPYRPGVLLQELGLRLRTVLSSPVLFHSEFLSVTFDWDVLSQPPLRNDFLPLSVRVVRRAGSRTDVYPRSLKGEGDMKVELEMADGTTPSVDCLLLLGGRELAAARVRVLNLDEILRSGQVPLLPDIRLEQGNVVRKPAPGRPEEIIVLLARRLTDRERRAWLPVRRVHQALRPASKLVITSGAPLPLGDIIPGLPAETDFLCLQEDAVSGPSGVLRQVLAAHTDLRGAAVLVYPGGAAATRMLSAFARERVLSAVVHILRERGTLRITLAESGPAAETAGKVAREWQVDFVRFSSDPEQDEWLRVIQETGPWW